MFVFCTREKIKTIHNQGVCYSQKYRVKRGFPNYFEAAIFLQFGSAKKELYIQLNLFSHLIIDQYSNCIIHRSESRNTIFSIFVYTCLA